MVENRDVFLKSLSELRELALKGSDADPQKFDALAKPLVWDIQNSFVLPISAEQVELIKILTFSEAGGEYWKGYGKALTDFWLPLLRSMYQADSSPEQKAGKSPTNATVETEPHPRKPAISESQAPDGFIMD